MLEPARKAAARKALAKNIVTAPLRGAGAVVKGTGKAIGKGLGAGLAGASVIAALYGIPLVAGYAILKAALGNNNN